LKSREVSPLKRSRGQGGRELPRLLAKKKGFSYYCWSEEAEQRGSRNERKDKRKEVLVSGQFPSNYRSLKGKPKRINTDTKSKVKVKFICIAHFMYKTIESALHKMKALQRGVEKALKICKKI